MKNLYMFLSYAESFPTALATALDNGWTPEDVLALTAEIRQKVSTAPEIQPNKRSVLISEAVYSELYEAAYEAGHEVSMMAELLIEEAIGARPAGSVYTGDCNACGAEVWLPADHPAVQKG